MKYPNFFDEIENIIVQDELSNFLGSSENGIIDISFVEIVKMAGHSCGVTAGAFLMAQKGLKALYGTNLPQRGQIKVELKGNLEDNTGVTAQVLTFITGATDNNGFMGIQGRFNRRQLLSYGANIEGNVRFTRLDNGQSVEAFYSPAKVVNPREILMSAIAPNATDEAKKTFPQRWQNMVKTLFDNADKIIEIR